MSNGLGSLMQGAAPQGPEQGMPQGQQGMPMPPANDPRMAAAMDVVEADIPESLKQLVSEKEFADKAKELLMSAGGQAAMNQTPPEPPTVAERVEKQAEEGVAGLLARLSPGIQQQGQQMAMAQRRAPMQGQRPPMQGQRPPMQGQRPPMPQQGVSGMPARNMMKAAQGGVVGFDGTKGSQVPPAKASVHPFTFLNWALGKGIDLTVLGAKEIAALAEEFSNTEVGQNQRSVLGEVASGAAGVITDAIPSALSQEEIGAREAKLESGRGGLSSLLKRKRPDDAQAKANPTGGGIAAHNRRVREAEGSRRDPNFFNGVPSNRFVGSSDLGGILSGTEQRAVNSSQAQVDPQFQNVLTEMPRGGTAPRATDSTQFDPNPPVTNGVMPTATNAGAQTTSGIMSAAPVPAPVRQETPLEKALRARQIETLGRDATAEGVAAGERYRELTGVEGLLAERKALQGEAKGLREERFSPERMKKRTLRAGLARLGEKGLGGFGSGYTSERDLIDSERAAAAGISLAEVEKMIAENRAMGMTQFEAENKARVEVDGIISEGGQIAQGMLATDQQREAANLDRVSKESIASARDETMLAQAQITADANQRVPTDTMSQLSIFTAQALRENSELSAGEAASAGLALYNAAQESLGLAKLGLTQQANFMSLQSKALTMAIANIEGRNPPVRPAEYDDLLEELVTKYAGQFTLEGGSTTNGTGGLAEAAAEAANYLAETE